MTRPSKRLKVTTEETAKETAQDTSLADILLDLVTFILPLVNLIQDYDLPAHVKCLLQRWTPELAVWPDQSSNPDITRYLVKHHAADVIVPFLHALLSKASRVAYDKPDSCTYCLHKYQSGAWRIILLKNGHSVNMEPLEQMVQHMRYEEVMHYSVDVRPTIQAVKLLPLFTTCPLFIPFATSEIIPPYQLRLQTTGIHPDPDWTSPRRRRWNL